MTASGAVPARAYLIDKPAGPTSHDVVAAVKRALGRGSRVGHAGTLDPFATGLLVVLSGRATRLARYLVGLDKTYEVRARLGASSATGDTEGPIVETGRRAQSSDVPRAIAALTGAIRQRVPAYSAVKVDGERLYARARRGESVERPERDVTIHELAEIDRAPDLEWIDLRVRCSSGTYVRTIVEDLGDILGCGAYCLSLRRTAVGEIGVTEAIPPDAVDPDGGHDPADVLRHLPRRELSADEAADVRHGRSIPGDLEGDVVMTHAGALVAIGTGEGEGGRTRPEVVLQ